jgi:hypothetical protein
MRDIADDGVIEEVFEPDPEGSGVALEDFYAYMPAHNYIFAPCREIWAAASIDARFPRVRVQQPNGKVTTIRPSRWLDQNRPVEQMSWCPGLPMLIEGRLVVAGGWIKRADVACFNLYRPPRIKLGDAAQATRWVTHVNRIYPAEADYIIRWLAHRVQRPEEKINHALVLGGNQGIGKDTLLEPLKHAVGPWNFCEVSPTHLLGRFNGYVKSVILRVSEGRDLGEVDRFKFYDHTKIYTAAPPDVLRVDEKNLREHYVFNVLGFILTTNHKLTVFICRPTIAGITSPGRTAAKRTSRPSIGTRSGTGTAWVDSGTSRRISARSTSPTSTPKPRRRRRRRSGTSSRQTVPPRMRSSLTYSTNSNGRTR